MRLGLFGGTFDPVHYGHLLLAEQCREQCGLDEVWFVPSGSPPHKRDAAISPAQRRVEMLEFAIAGHPAFRVSDVELKREGPTYTVDTLRAIIDEPDAPPRELFFLIGGDSLKELVAWREPARIAELATIVAVNRGGKLAADLEMIRERLGGEVAKRIRPVEIPRVDVSSTDVRRRVREGRSIRYMTPRPVEESIRLHGLYRDAAE